MKDVKINLCDTCKFNISECDAHYEFGAGVGSGNVIVCKFHEVKEDK